MQDVQGLTYSNAVISEALRMYPPLPISSGRCVAGHGEGLAQAL